MRTFFRIFNSPREQSQFAIIAESVGTAEKLLIDDNASPFNILAKGIYKYYGGRKPHIRLHGRYGLKYIYLGGFSTARDYKKILGINLNGLHIEELSASHDDFVRESFVRASRLVTKPWLIATTNGGLPSQIFYTEFFDKGNYNELYNSNMPTSTKEILDKIDIKDDRFEYIFFGFEDSATQTDEIIDDIKRTFPPGTFFFNSKVIGARSAPTGAIYAEYIKDEHIIKYEDAMNRDKYNLIKYTIGVDVGSTNYTVFTLVGFTSNFKIGIVLDYFKINEAGTDEIMKAFENWYDTYFKNIQVHSKVHGLFFDYAGGGSVLKKSIERKIQNKYNLLSANTYKKRIIDRIEANVKLFYADRLLFTDKTIDIADAFKSVIYTKDKNKTDPRVWFSPDHKDLVDSTEYAQSPFIDIMLRKA